MTDAHFFMKKSMIEPEFGMIYHTFGSHTFALALEHEQTVETYKVTDVPNPRNESSSNWVSNPNQILDESYVWEINNMLSQLEDSLN